MTDFHPCRLVFVERRFNLVGHIIHLASKEVQRLAGPVTVNQSKQQQHLSNGIINTQTGQQSTAGTLTVQTYIHAVLYMQSHVNT